MKKKNEALESPGSKQSSVDLIDGQLSELKRVIEQSQSSRQEREKYISEKLDWLVNCNNQQFEAFKDETYQLLVEEEQQASLQKKTAKSKSSSRDPVSAKKSGKESKHESRKASVETVRQRETQIYPKKPSVSEADSQMASLQKYKKRREMMEKELVRLEDSMRKTEDQSSAAKREEGRKCESGRQGRASSLRMANQKEGPRVLQGNTAAGRNIAVLEERRQQLQAQAAALLRGDQLLNKQVLELEQLIRKNRELKVQALKAKKHNYRF